MSRYLLILGLLCFAPKAPLQAQQFRAAWADVFHVGMGSQVQVDAMVASLVAGRYNAVVVQVLGYMDSNGTGSHGAHWKSSILPWSPRVTSSFDPLAYLCTQAHANGIQVHAWLGGSGGGPYRVSTVWPPGGNATLAGHPEWFMVPQANSEGNAIVTLDGSYLLDMGSPDAQNYIISIVRELVTNYPIDGINWDDEINGAGYTQGYAFPAYSAATYPRSGLARYRTNTGFVGTPSANDGAYSNYRRRFKNELMARSQAEIQSIKTNPRQPVRHTSATMAYGNPASTCDFTSTTPYIYYSDWAGMLQNGWLDAVIPQNYKVETSNGASYRAWCDRSYSCWRYNRHIYIGLGAYLNTKANTVTQLQYAYAGQAGGNGLNGTTTYSYGVPSSDGGDWWGYAAANIYTNTATVPTMPWRNPATATEGIMWGRVLDAKTGFYVDDATVTVTGGPTVKTDGNGYYVATLIPATAGGTVHSTTASKTGMTSQTMANATVLAGDVVRYDFTLNVPSTPPVITMQPQSQTIPSGQNATFTVSASGTPPLAYQWRFNGNNISGATATAYTVNSAVLSNSGPYSVSITNAAGTAVSSNAFLTVVTLAAAGNNSWGQLNVPPESTNAIAIAAGAWHSLALRADGRVTAWGNNFNNQCAVPETLTDAVAIAAGGYHSLAIKANGKVVPWGANDYGQTTIPAGLANVIGIAGGTWHSLALRANGTLAVWGDNSLGQTNVPAGLSNVVAIAAGGSHNLALKTDGTVVAWGDNTDAGGTFVGQSVVPSGLSDVVAIAAGEYHSLAVRSNGTVVAWGDNSQSQCAVPPGLTNVVAIAGGGAHSLALKADGSVAAWGANSDGQCNLPPNLTNVVAVAAGESHTLLLLEGSLPVFRLLNPGRNGARFSALLQTLNRKNYVLEFKNSLQATGWTTLPTVTGNGALRQLTDTPGSGPQRFYRVRQW